jgi:hypothetical protein
MMDVKGLVFVPLKDFFDETGRGSSQSVSYGYWWRSDLTPNVAYEFCWLETTKECCLLRRPTSSKVEAAPFGVLADVIMGLISYPAYRQARRLYPAGGSVVVNAVERDEIEMRIRGWKERMSQEDSLRWLLKRISRSVQR